MAIETRTILIPKTCKCEVKYYIEAEPKKHTEGYFADLFFVYENNPYGLSRLERSSRATLNLTRLSTAFPPNSSAKLTTTLPKAQSSINNEQ